MSNKENCAIKYFSTATEDGKIPSVLKTSYWEPCLETNKLLKVKDTGISNYYSSNSGAVYVLNYTFKSLPGVWFITKEYDRVDTGTEDNNLPAGLNTHIGSYVFTNAKGKHGITYSAKGRNYEQSAEGVIGSCKKDNITCLNVSELNKNGNGNADNITAWTGSSNTGRYETYETMQLSGTQLNAGFVAKTNNGQNHGTTGDYVYMLPTGWWFNNSKHIFTVSYSIDGKEWKIVGADPNNSDSGKRFNQLYDLTEAMDNPNLYKKCLFTTDVYNEDSTNRTVSSKTSKVNVDYPYVGAGSCDIAKFSGKKISNSVICTDTYKNLTGQPNKSIFGEEDEIGNLRCIRINAKELGWLENGVGYVDVNITFISTNALNRSFTIPIKFYNSTKTNCAD